MYGLSNIVIVILVSVRYLFVQIASLSNSSYLVMDTTKAKVVSSQLVYSSVM